MKLPSVFNRSALKSTQRRPEIKKKRKTQYFIPSFQTKKKSYKKRSKWSSFYIPKKYLPKNILHYKVWSIILVLLVAWYIFLWPLLKIQNIFISREDKIVSINQAYENLSFIRWKNILFLQSNEIIERLQKWQKTIKNIEIKAHFPNTLDIRIWAYEIMFQTQTHFILQNGLIIEKKDLISDTPEIILSRSDNDTFLWREELTKIDSLLNSLKKNILWFTINKIYFAENEKELILSHTNGNIFIFDIYNNVERQIEKLTIYHKESENINEKKYVYLDIRIPNKLFICGFETEFDCKSNLTKIYGKTLYNTLSSISSPLSQ